MPNCSLDRIHESSNEDTVAALGVTEDSSISVSGTMLVRAASAWTADVRKSEVLARGNSKHC